MNLSSIHLADLIQVLHGVLAPQPVALRGESRRVVEFEGRWFALLDQPLTVEGPFGSVAELVTSLGRREKETSDVWFWDGCRLRVEGDRVRDW
jgi:hypothetical protein